MRETTRAVHAGENPFSPGRVGDVVSPIHVSSTFARRVIHKPTGGYEYSRSANPTRDAYEKALAELEGAKYALGYSSGLAAGANILLALLGKGDHVVASDDLYGGTRRLFLKTFGKFGLDFSFVDAREPANVESAIRENTKIVWLESPTNPTLKLCDIREISGIAHKGGAIAVVDNTFASPYFQNPLSLEADIVLHSATKYIGGHSNVINGAVMVSDEGLHEKLRFQQNAVGAVPSPFDAHTIHVQLKTLGLRMERHAQNAQDVAEFLEAHPKVKRVYYPGLKSHPQHELAKTQMRGFGGMVSFEIRGGMEAAARFLKSLEIFLLAESLGGVESLAEHPASMTHASVSREDRMRAGLSDGLVRLSVGIEDSGDLISDLDNSLK
ncbi:cystathionine gamma-synthase [Candidatus Micrarchaeota archaeon CG1_02_47_40]|nr:MAG: cystathionine gamma-synthase [Candidatus Micrarchaeota archaeon CG1_02_47_40]QBM01435.1 hypothetical protein [uncultured archaeon]